MHDDNSTFSSATATPAAAYAPRRSRSGAGTVLAVLVAFLIGAGLTAYAAWRGDLDAYLPARPGNAQAIATDDGTDTAGGATGVRAQGDEPSVQTGQRLAAMTAMETRLALLEDRFSRLNFQANAASGHAARAEGLLIAFAARRTIERGEPLGYVADQLTLRFADAQPQAVETITEFARRPVTLDQLSARLEALAPDLTDTSRDRTLWERARVELSNLFTVRSDSPTLVAPAARIDRARLMLTARRIGPAIDEVERLPGAEAARTWIADARRFQEAQRALDRIETTAMLEPRRLKDGSGQEVDEPSPLSTPAPSLAPATTATPGAQPGI